MCNDRVDSLIEDFNKSPLPENIGNMEFDLKSIKRDLKITRFKTNLRRERSQCFSNRH